MKKFWLIGLVIAVMAMPVFVSAQVETGAGTMQIGGKIKWMYIYQAENEDQVGAGAAGQLYGFDGAAMEQFVTTNVELDINGTVGENVAYVIELQATDFGLPNNAYGGLAATASGYNELQGSAIGVRQAKILVSDVIPMTTVTLGTFNLPVGNYQERGTNDWDTVMLPLMNMLSMDTTTPGPPIGLGWQVTGAMFTLGSDMVSLDLATFNGISSATPNVQRPMDLEMGYMANLGIGSEGAGVEIAYLSEGWQENVRGTGPGVEQQNSTAYVISACVMNDQMEMTADWFQNTIEEYQMYNGKWEDVNSSGWQATVGVFLTDQIEALVRYEVVDPNMADTRATLKGGGTTNSKYDELQATTIGLNYLINENAEMAINYIMIAEEGKEIDQDPTKPTKNAGANLGERQGVDNDTLLIPVQVWQ